MGTILYKIGKEEFYTGFLNGALRIKKDEKYYFIDRFGKVIKECELCEQ